jgi:hypothetical protein
MKFLDLPKPGILGRTRTNAIYLAVFQEYGQPNVQQGKVASDGTASETCVRFLQMELFKSGAGKVGRQFLFAITEEHEPKMDNLHFVRLRLRIHVTSVISNLEVPNS